MSKDYIHKLRCFRHYFWYLHQIIYFNFHYLPFHQAKHLPIWVKFRNGVRHKFNTGIIKIESETISFGMIELGVLQYYEEKEGIFFANYGTLIFKGAAHISNGCDIQVYDHAKLTIGDGVGMSKTKITCAKEIEIGRGTFIGVGTKFIDSDFHPIIDIFGKCYLNPSQSIRIGEYNWLGADVLVTKGARTPNHCIISARSVINKKYKIPECTIINNATGQEVIMEGYIRDRNITYLKRGASRKIEDFDNYIKTLI